ncbi:MAG TPA: hypothetical protein VL652_24205 [Kutzneria sp.]|nr:hypothetical protein [Kutzneria sp.]
MISSETSSLRAAAARNNAEWCALVCRSHGIPSSFGATVWRSAGRTPPYYPDVVTLRPDAALQDFLPGVGLRGYSIKDSFADLDLAVHGFVELFAAQWIYRPAGLRAPATSLRTQRVCAGELGAWQAAWHGGDDAPDVFRPALLGDSSVLVLGFRRGEELVGGVVLNRSVGVVGLSNLFAVDSRDVGEVWSSAIVAAGGYCPGLPVVGYEQREDVVEALASGFGVVGPLRVWVRGE